MQQHILSGSKYSSAEIHSVNRCGLSRGGENDGGCQQHNLPNNMYHNYGYAVRGPGGEQPTRLVGVLTMVLFSVKSSRLASPECPYRIHSLIFPVLPMLPYLS